ncbi:DUF935 domain-containing protein [Desulfovibrio sp.]|uniref:DUF935 domain-containing protein n=2 Tax=Desulfovibrio sp. TaxID=885 RepID=UPI003AAC3A8A
MRYKAKRPPRNPRPSPEALRGAVQTESGDTAPLLYLEQLPNLTHGLTPGKLRRILADAEQGNIVEQHALFADMEDRCEHLACEIGKRKRALLTLEWDIIPGSDDARAREVAEKVRAMVDMMPGVEDMLLDMADAIGHGFAALELEWGMVDGWHIPQALTFRPQSWFQCLWTDRNRLRLRDGSAEGAELWPCGWLVHTHKSKSGWLPRAGLFRTVAWAYLIRAYALNANIAYTQIHGLPLRLGKYPPGSTSEDKSALLHALRCLGQDAAGIIPAGMEVIFQTPTTATQDIPGQMVTRCEQGMSKAILGGTLTTQADGKTSTNALGTIHNEIRRDLLAADAMQLAATLTSQLLAPLCLLNLGITDRKLLPYWRFDTQEAGDLSLYADALPKLAPYMKISRQFVHERLKLPVALDEDDVFRADGQDGDGSDDRTEDARPGRQKTTTRLTAPVGGDGKEDGEETGAGQDALDKMCDSADAALAEAAGALLGPLFAEVAAGLPPEELEKRLADLYPAMDATQLTDILSRLLFVAQLEGRSREEETH